MLLLGRRCAVCDGWTGRRGNECWLDNGEVLCRQCVEKLSPWYQDFREADGEKIQSHLDYREKNFRELTHFHITRTLGMGRPGSNTLLYLDDNTGRFMVTGMRDLRRANPDVLDLSQVTSCDVRVAERRTEDRMEDGSGQALSYSPNRFRYRYDFCVSITVDHPWFTNIRYWLNEKPVEVIGQQYSFGAFFNAGSRREIGRNVYGPGMNDHMFQECKRVGEEIRTALTRSYDRGGYR